MLLSMIVLHFPDSVVTSHKTSLDRNLGQASADPSAIFLISLQHTDILSSLFTFALFCAWYDGTISFFSFINTSKCYNTCRYFGKACQEKHL